MSGIPLPAAPQASLPVDDSSHVFSVCEDVSGPDIPVHQAGFCHLFEKPAVFFQTLPDLADGQLQINRSRLRVTEAHIHHPFKNGIPRIPLAFRLSRKAETGAGNLIDSAVYRTGLPHERMYGFLRQLLTL